ncbi:hypothetical protein GCM10012275_61990 [Longimycelium tulufanense]|uniref:Uncharacterized protein n=1 Tax=Longimycelium tulufanense TaxID=907463 RepID=A0A8J3CEG6_9PSEU|nr:hypothetical protein GCM10012275_61990 [Longimycelium tulufanense]
MRTGNRGSGPLEADALLSGDEIESRPLPSPPLLSDVSQVRGDAPWIRDAASAAWALLANRAATQGGYPPARDDSYYRQQLGRMQNRDRPRRTGQ